MINDCIRTFINDNIDESYRKFQSKLIPNIDNIEGVRIPLLRKLAKIVAKKEDVDSYLDNPILNTYEEIIVYGLVLGYLNVTFDKFILDLKKFIPHINNWSVCDTVVSNLKIIKKNKSEFLKIIDSYLCSNEEYYLRFCIVVLNDYYLDDLDLVFARINLIKSDFYYVNMAIAWLISSAYKKDKNKTIEFLNNNNLSDFVNKKAIQKIHELALYQKKY